MKRYRKHNFSHCLLGLAFCMLQLHMMAGCCFVHHGHAHLDEHFALEDLSALDGHIGRAGLFSCEQTAGAACDGRSVAHEVIDASRFVHGEEGVHFCDSSPNCPEEAASCVIFFMPNSSKQLIKISLLFLSFGQTSFNDVSPTVKIAGRISSDCFLVSASENPLYLRNRSFLI